MRNAFLILLLLAGAFVGCGATGPTGNNEGSDCSAGNGRGPVFGTPTCTAATPPPGTNPVGAGIYAVGAVTTAQAAFLGPANQSAEGGGATWEALHPGGAGSSIVYAYMSGQYASHSGSEPAGNAPYFYFDKEAVYQEGMFWHTGPPANFSGGPASTTSCKWSWVRDARNDTGGYNIYSANTATTNGFAQFALIGHVASGVTTFTQTGMTTGTTQNAVLTTVTVSTTTATNMPTVGASATLTLGAGNTTGIMNNHWVKICDNGGTNCGNEKVTQWTSSTITIGKVLKAHTACSTAACPVSREQVYDGMDPLYGINSTPATLDDGTGYTVALSGSHIMENTSHEYGQWLSSAANSQGVTAPSCTPSSTTVELSNYGTTAVTNNPNPPFSVNSPGAQATPVPGTSASFTAHVDEYNSAVAPHLFHQYNPNCCSANTWTDDGACTAGTAPTWNCTSGTISTVAQNGRIAARICQGSLCTPTWIVGGVNNRSTWESGGAPEDATFVAAGQPEAQYTLEQMCTQEMKGPQGAFNTIPATTNPLDGCRWDDMSPLGPAPGGASQPELSPVDTSINSSSSGVNYYWPSTTGTFGGGTRPLNYGLSGLAFAQTFPIAVSLFENANGFASMTHNCGNPPSLENPTTLVYNHNTGGIKANLCDNWFTSSTGTLNYSTMQEGYYNQLQDVASLLWLGEYQLLHPINPTDTQRYDAFALMFILADNAQHTQYRYVGADRYPEMYVSLGPKADAQQQYVGPCTDDQYINSNHCDFSISRGYWNATCQAYVVHYTYGVVVFAPGGGGFNQQTGSNSCFLGGTSYFHLQAGTTNITNGGTCTFDVSGVTSAPALGANHGWIGVDSAHESCPHP